MDNSSLIQLFENRGETLETRRGQTVALSLSAGNSGAELLQSGCALVWQGTTQRIDVTGRHRHRFLHNMTTCQIKTLEPGQGNYGLVVNDGGKLVAQFMVECEDDSLILEVSPDEAEPMLAQLKKYIIADDVKFAPFVSKDLLVLAGPTADELMKRAGGNIEDLGDYAWMDLTIGQQTCRVRRNPLRLGTQGWDLLVSPDASASVWTALEELGAVPLGFNAWEFLRVDNGWPITGIDFGDDNIPLEADKLAETIDWDKGCYIGQEVIAMMHYRGRPNKHLGKITFNSLPTDYAPGLELTMESGKKAGRLGSVASSPDGTFVGLAVVKRRHAEDGAQLTAPCGTTGTFHRFPKYVVE